MSEVTPASTPVFESIVDLISSWSEDFSDTWWSLLCGVLGAKQRPMPPYLLLAGQDVLNSSEVALLEACQFLLDDEEIGNVGVEADAVKARMLTRLVTSAFAAPVQGLFVDLGRARKLGFALLPAVSRAP
jgi:hypothetical protein